MAIQTIIYHNQAFYPIFSEAFQNIIVAKLHAMVSKMIFCVLDGHVGRPIGRK